MLRSQATDEKYIDESFSPTIRISLYTHKKCYYGPISDLFFGSHILTHSSAIIEHIPTHEEYLISFGNEISYEVAMSHIKDSIQSGYYSTHQPHIIMAYENNDKTFEKFKTECNRLFPIHPRPLNPLNNCANATTFAINYFPKYPIYQESWGTVLYRWAAKLLCGFFGSCLGIRACYTFPGMTSPVEVKEYACAIEKNQQRFFAKGPQQQTMEDDCLPQNKISR